MADHPEIGHIVEEQVTKYSEVMHARLTFSSKNSVVKTTTVVSHPIDLKCRESLHIGHMLHGKVVK